MTDAIQEARNMLETVKNEIYKLDEMMQLYEGVREIVVANDGINKENDVFWLMTVTFFDSALIRLRRLVDADCRSTSLVTLIDHLRKNSQSFTRAWHKSMCADAPDLVREREEEWWQERADKTRTYLCQDRLLCLRERVIDQVRKCKRWVNKMVAHLDRRSKLVRPTVKEFKKAFDRVREAASDLHVLLTGKSEDLRPNIEVDWENVLRVPWIPQEPASD